MRFDRDAVLRIAAVALLAIMPLAAAAEDLSDLHVVEARIIRPAEGEAPQLAARFDEVGRLRFSNWTSRHVGEMVDVLVDGRVPIRLKLLTQITGGSIAFTGFDASEMEALIPRLLDGRSRLALRSDERI